MSRLVFLDTETTGLNPDYHDVWEVAAITEDGKEHVWLLDRVHLGRADPMALQISGFHERHPHGWDAPFEADTTNHLQFCRDFGQLTYGAHLVGAVPSFDAAFLRRLFLDAGWQPAWHYHLIDVEAMAVGYLHGRDGGKCATCGHQMTEHGKHGCAADDEAAMGGCLCDWTVGLPWKSDDLSRACGVEPPGDAERHTALGDARWCKRLYEAITGVSA